ncbi:MAG TPA: NifU family protein [Melioribacteraceae bacterium]|nr:NifU family protein [Melioribacteraceae bacterium]
MSSVFYEKVEEALKKIRPFLQADGGDVELVRVTEDGIVEVKLTGACVGCPMSQMTLRAGVERALLKEIPGIRRVEQVNI